MEKIKTIRIFDKVYDVTNFKHPGGVYSLDMGASVEDATALFISYHSNLPYKSLNSLNILPLGSTSNSHIGEKKYTFDKEGFYINCKNFVKEELYKQGYRINNTKAPAIYKFITFLHILLIINIKFLFYSNAYANATLLISTGVVLGILRGLMITREAHAASHQAWSKHADANQYIYRIAVALMGGSVEHWNEQHIRRHHIDTNVHERDYDSMHPIKRVYADQKLNWYHRYQHIYIWGFYSVLMTAWTFGDLLYLVHIRNTSVQLTLKNKMYSGLTSLVYIIHSWVLPFVVFDFNNAIIFMMTETFIASIFFSFQFIVNHEVPNTTTTKVMDWGEFQIVSSSDFNPKSRFWSEVSGGLNNQIAHHLFPAVHFSYYPIITKSIVEFCNNNNVQYKSSGTLVEALKKHYDLLKMMGRPDKIKNK